MELLVTDTAIIHHDVKKPTRTQATDAAVLLRALMADAHSHRAVPDADWYRLAVTQCEVIGAYVGLDPIELQKRALRFTGNPG